MEKKTEITESYIPSKTCPHCGRTQTNTAITKPCLLLVEGWDDAVVFEALSRSLNLTGIQIWPIIGKDRLRGELNTLLTLGLRDIVVSVGIVRDADNDSEAAFDSVCSALRSTGLSAPEHPSQSAAGQGPVITVLIIPGGNSPGMIEDVCLKSVEDKPAMQCVDGYLNCLREHVENGCALGNPSKAKVQVFMASRPECERRIGDAAQHDCWNLEHEAFSEARTFLRQIASFAEQQNGAN